MLGDNKINARQLFMMMALFIIGTSILLAPSMLASVAKQDSWIAAILGLGAGLFIMWLYKVLGEISFPLNMVAYSEEILGKWLGKGTSLLYFVYLLILCALVLRNIGDFVTTQLIPETPIEVIHILFMTIVIMGARIGLEPIARASEIFFPWTILFFFIIVITISPQGKLEKIQPVLENGIKPVLAATVPYIAFPFLELAAFLMIFPNLNRPNEVGKAYSMGVFIGGTVIVAIVALSILVLGADITTRHLYPSYMLAKKINVANFFMRVEVILAAIWILSTFIKLTLCFYISLLVLTQTLSLKEYRILTFPIGMMLIVLSLAVSPNITYDLTVVPKTMTLYTVTFGLVWPLLLLGVGYFKNRKAKKCL